MARKSEQKIVADIAGVIPNTTASLQEVIRQDKAYPPGTTLQEMLGAEEDIYPRRGVQEQLFENLKDDLSLTDPFTKYSDQAMLEMAGSAGLTIDQICGITPTDGSVLLETGDVILLETGDAMLLE